MTCGLATEPEWDVRLLMSSDLDKQDSFRSDRSRMDEIPNIRLPFSRRTAEALWRTMRYPAVDRWLDGADWVYCPRELYVPVRKARYAVTVHDLYRLEPEYRQPSVRSGYRWGHLLKRALEEANLVLSVSEFTKRRLVELVGLEEEKIRVVGNGVEERFFAGGVDHMNTAAIADEQKYVLSIGGVTRKKGAVNLLAAASVLAQIAPGRILVIIGPIEPEFAPRVAATRNIRIVRRGFPDAEMLRLVRNAGVMLVLSEYEGFGIPALEAMAAGVPVVAADRAALPEVVGQAGVLVDPADPEEVAQTIVRVCDDAELWGDLVARGRVQAERYRWAACVERLSLALEEFSPQSGGVAST